MTLMMLASIKVVHNGPSLSPLAQDGPWGQFSETPVLVMHLGGILREVPHSPRQAGVCGLAKELNYFRET